MSGALNPKRGRDIDADAQRVWELFSEPGWWINDGTVTEHRVETEGDISVEHDPVHGTFRMQLDSPRYAGYRWLSEAGSDEPGEASTLIEFWISDRPDGGVALRVVESGFDSLDASAEQRRKTFDDNSEGWMIELDAARAHVVGA